MATSEMLRRVSAPEPLQYGEKLSAQQGVVRDSQWFWMGVDALTVLLAACLTILIRWSFVGSGNGVRMYFADLLRGPLAVSVWCVLLGFTAGVLERSRELKLYAPIRFIGILQEQKNSLHACLSSGLLLMGGIYLLHAQGLPRGMVTLLVVLATLGVSLRRLAWRWMLKRRYQHGIGVRNVLIVGTGPEAQALGSLLRRRRSLGYELKGYVTLPGDRVEGHLESGKILGSIRSLFPLARRLFVDEVLLVAPRERGLVAELLTEARALRVDLRVVPEVYGGQLWKAPAEFLGEFPTIALHQGKLPESGLLLKRALDILLSSLVLLGLSPLLVAIALWVRLDSPGPIFYQSERLGKKGRIFRCLKFRTMVPDAEKRLAEVMHLNERDGVLFKVSNDPRITRLGRWLRKYSLDELPQFFNVLCGEMSVVGPRPPLASEVREYKVDHLRRLEVMPGITGLWQVEGRKDPSFDSYVSLDVSYIENWSLGLDLSIVLRTVWVVLAGTGS